MCGANVNLMDSLISNLECTILLQSRDKKIKIKFLVKKSNSVGYQTKKYNIVPSQMEGNLRVICEDNEMLVVQDQFLIHLHVTVS